MPEPQDDDLGQAFSAFARAMQDGDTAALRRLTSARFTLTHMTGYLQPRDEWLDEIEDGKFVYYSVEIRDIRVSESADRLVARTVTDAQVYGGRNRWKLQLALSYIRDDGRWIADKALASLWT